MTSNTEIHMISMKLLFALFDKGTVLRITCSEGPQAGDVNLWNARNYKEQFYSGKTRQLHRSHLSLYDKLWSCFPYLNPMATVVGDSIMYGIDEGIF